MTHKKLIIKRRNYDVAKELILSHYIKQDLCFNDFIKNVCLPNLTLGEQIDLYYELLWDIKNYETERSDDYEFIPCGCGNVA